MAIQIIHTLNMEKEEWIEWRRSGIGGSDIGSILGFNKYSSPMKVYLSKIGEYDEEVNNDAVYWGNVLEDVVAKEFSKRTGYKVRRNNFLLQHPKYPFLQANVDRMIISKEKGNGILECKTASEYLKNSWEDDEVPPNYYLQVQHYLAVTGLKWGALAVLIGGRDFRYFEIKRDDELIEQMIQQAKFFWEQYVEKRDPPPIDGSDSSVNLLSSLYPESVPETQIELPGEALGFMKEYEEAKKQEDFYKQQKREAENKIKSILGDNEQGILGDYKVTWKTVNSTRLDTKLLKAEQPDIFEKYSKVSSSRRFTIK